MDLIKSGSYIDIFYAKACATTKISTVAGYHVVLATLVFSIATYILPVMSPEAASLIKMPDVLQWYTSFFSITTYILPVISPEAACLMKISVVVQWCISFLSITTYIVPVISPEAASLMKIPDFQQWWISFFSIIRDYHTDFSYRPQYQPETPLPDREL